MDYKARRDYRHRWWRTWEGKLYRLGDMVICTGHAVQDARKPHDLVFPITRLIDLSVQLRLLMWFWVAEKIGLDRRDWGTWPKV